jgi:hypothetical protein
VDRRSAPATATAAWTDVRRSEGRRQALAAHTEGIDIARRKALITVFLLLALGTAGCSPATVVPPDTEPYPDEPFVPARSARSFGDSVGVGVRLTWIDTAYGDYATLKSRLQELGVRNVHDGLCATCQYQIDRLKDLSANGIKALIGVGDLRGGTAKMQANLNAIRDKLPGVATAVVAPNEPDLEPVSDWVTMTRDYQRELWTRVKGDPALAHLPVLGPSLVNRESRDMLGDLSQYLDRGNLHPYPGGSLPLANLDDEKWLASKVSGSKPLVSTEVGYHTDLSFDGAHRPVSEAAKAVYTPRLVLEAFLGGIERSYLFQLADPWSPAEAASLGVPGPENAFGLLDSNLARKPSFLSLRNLMRAADSGSAAVATPGGLRYGLEGAGPDVKQLLLRSADGSYALVLWRQVSVWDRNAKRDLSPTPDDLDVVMGEPIGLARRFDPVTSDVEQQRWSAPRRISVSLAGAPVVLRLTPAEASSTAEPETTPSETTPSTPPETTPAPPARGTTPPPAGTPAGGSPAAPRSQPRSRAKTKAKRKRTRTRRARVCRAARRARVHHAPRKVRRKRAAACHRARAAAKRRARHHRRASRSSRG